MSTMDIMTYVDQIKGLMAKSDGKDKTIALLQYCAMTIANGEAGNALLIQKSLGVARKPFRPSRKQE